MMASKGKRPSQRRVQMKRYYSGDDSRPFWARVNNPKLNDSDHARLYAAGVLLREMESRILNWLENAEKSAGYKQRKEQP